MSTPSLVEEGKESPDQEVDKETPDEGGNLEVIVEEPEPPEGEVKAELEEGWVPREGWEDEQEGVGEGDEGGTKEETDHILPEDQIETGADFEEARSVSGLPEDTGEGFEPTTEYEEVQLDERVEVEQKSPEIQRPSVQFQDVVEVLEEPQQDMSGDEEMSKTMRIDEELETELEEGAADEEWIASLMPEMLTEALADEEELIPVRDGAEENEPRRTSMVVLEADNPLMVRFQQTLKAHLLRQLDRLKSQIHEMEGELKLKTSEKAKFGEMIFRETHLLKNQLGTIVEYRKTMEEMGKQKEKVDQELAMFRKRVKDTTLELRNTKKRDEYLLMEFEALSDIVKQMEDYEKAQASELSLSHYQSEANKKLKEKLSVEKQQQDYIMWRLNKEVNRLVNEYKVIQKNADEEVKNCENLSQLLVDVEVDLKNLGMANTVISKGINRAFFVVEKKDQTICKLKEKYDEVDRQWLSVCSKFSSYDNSITSEMRRNESLTNEQLRKEDQLAGILKGNQDLKKKMSSSMEQIAKVEQMIEYTQLDYDQVGFSNNKLRSKLSVITKETDALQHKRHRLENVIVERLQEKIANSLIFSGLNKLITKLGEENIKQEEAIATSENNLARAMYDLEQEKVAYSNNEINIEQLQNKVKEKTMKLSLIQETQCKLEHDKKALLKQLATNRIQLNQLKEDCEKGLLISPTEIKLKDVKAKLVDKREELQQLQNDWLATQNELVICNEKRSKQLLEITFNKKHLLVSQEKADRLDDEIEELITNEKRARRDIIACQTALQNMEMIVHRKQEHTQMLASKTKDIQSESSYQLKKEEESILDLQNEIRELEESNRDDTLVVTELQREFLTWDKRFKLAVETRQNIEKEKASCGEIGIMKLEIHRMEVRYAQLRKAQEKLIGDLELCISRRDNIVDMAYARERRSTKANVNYTKHNFNKKIEDLRSKLKKAVQNAKQTEKDIEENTEQRTQLHQEYEDKIEHLDSLRSAIGQLENQIFEGQIHKHKNLELIVRRQKKCRYLEDIKSNKYKLHFKNEKGIEAEEQRQERLHTSLVEIVDQLTSDFPGLKLQLIQIRNTLNVSVNV